MPHLSPDELLARAQNALGEDARAAADAHLATCADCRSVVSELAKTSLASPLDLAREDGQPAEPLAPGAAWGRYQLLYLVGAGGMGEVFSAYDPTLDRKVAVKVLKTGVADARERARLFSEARALGRLSHPNVVAVFDAGEHGGRLSLATELIDGLTLRQWVKARQRGWRETVDAYRQAARGLHAAHSAGIIHRDFKPENAMIDADGRVRVMDFGLAQRLDTAPNGELAGTPAYMAPEQRRGEPLTAAVDQYALCAALEEALAGTAGVPQWVHRAIQRGRAARLEDRFPTLAALDTALAGPKPLLRRGLVLAAAALLIAASAAAVSTQVSARRRLCQGSEQQLQGVWDGALRAKLEQELLATGAPYARATASTTTGALDRYAQAWIAMHREACEATHLRGDQTQEALQLRTECLATRRRELSRLVNLLLQTPPPVESAARAALGLPSLEPCENVAGLRAVLPLPSDPAQRAEAERVGELLAEVKALYLAARYPDAAKVVVEALARAERLGHPGLLADARLRGALIKSRLADPRAAERLLLDATSAAERARDDALRARAWTTLVWLRATQLSDPVGAEQALEQAQAILQRTGASDEQVALLEQNVGRLRRVQSRLVEAQEHARKSVALWARAKGETDFAVTEPLRLLGEVEFVLGHYEDAQRSQERALTISEAAVGPWHPAVADGLDTLSRALHMRGDVAAALAAHRRAAEILERVFGPEHPRTLNAWSALGYDLQIAGDVEQGRALCERARGEAERIHNDAALTLALACEASSLALLERLPEALTRYRQLLERTQDPLALGELRMNIGSLLTELKRPREALLEYEQALALFTPKLGSEHPFCAIALAGRGLAHAALGDRAQAVDELQRALELLDAQKAGRDGDRGDVRFGLAKVLWPSEPRRALALASEAEQLFNNQGRVKKKSLEEARRWLAQRRPAATASGAPPASSSRP